MKLVENPTEQRLGSGDEVLYQTPCYLIGKTLWRMEVYIHRRYGNCTRYLWLKPANMPDWWRTDHEWPTADGNHCDGGLPKSVAKIYHAHRDAIEAAVGKEAQPCLS